MITAMTDRLALVDSPLVTVDDSLNRLALVDSPLVAVLVT